MRLLALALLTGCSPAVVGFPADPASPVGTDGPADDTAVDTGDTDDTGGPDDTGGDTAPCVGAWHPDGDGDGFGDAATTSTDCEAPSGWVADASDCDDADAGVRPGASEVCDGLDQDCDGVADDGLGDACAGGPDLRDPEASGWTVVGTGATDGVGEGGALSAGDLDGDGWDELVVAAPLHGASDAGAVAFHGADSAAPDVPFERGTLVTGEEAGDRFGASLALLGDVDRDGWDEVLVGAPRGDEEETDGGAAWILDLRSGAGVVSDRASGSVVGASSAGWLGAAVAAGDLDGDGTPELVLGAPGESSGRGRVYVGAGDDRWWTGARDTEDLEHQLVGRDAGDALGSAVAVAEDLDGDGYGDLVACAPGYAGDAGACWLVTGDWDEEIEGETITAFAGATFTGASAGDALGEAPGALAVADFDGDGTVDLALGAPGWDGGAAGGGGVGCWWGGALAGTHALTDADGLYSGDGALGRAVSATPDLDGDGAAELLAGAPTAGRLYLLAPADGAAVAADAARTLWTGAAADAFGAAAGALTDLDGDGTVDLAAAAPTSDASATDGGTVYVLAP